MQIQHPMTRHPMLRHAISSQRRSAPLWSLCAVWVVRSPVSQPPMLPLNPGCRPACAVNQLGYRWALASTDPPPSAANGMDSVHFAAGAAEKKISREQRQNEIDPAPGGHQRFTRRPTPAASQGYVSSSTWRQSLADGLRAAAWREQLRHLMLPTAGPLFQKPVPAELVPPTWPDHHPWPAGQGSTYTIVQAIEHEQRAAPSPRVPLTVAAGKEAGILPEPQQLDYRSPAKSQFPLNVRSAPSCPPPALPERVR